MSEYDYDTGPIDDDNIIDDDSRNDQFRGPYDYENPDSGSFIDPFRDLAHYGNPAFIRVAVLNGSLPLDLLTDEQQRALQVGPYEPEEVPEDDLLNGDPDLTGGGAADDMQIESILGQAQEFSSGANGFAAVWEDLPEDLGELEKQLIEQLQNRLLAGGGIGWEFNPAEGDSIFFKLPVVIPGMSGIMKIKIRNPDGTFKSPGEITAAVGEQIKNTVNEVVALPGKLLEQAKTILSQGGDLAEILAGTSTKTLEEVVGDVFGGIFGIEGEERTGDVWEVLIGQLTDRTISNESTEGGLFDLGDSETATTAPVEEPPAATGEEAIPASDTVKTTETSEPTEPPVTIEPPVTTETPVTTEEEKRLTIPTADTVKTNETSEPEEPPVTTEPIVTAEEPVTTDLPVITEEETTTDLPVTTEPTEPTEPIDPTEPTEPTEPVVEPPPPSGGGGGGGGSGMFKPHIGGINYALPQFTGVPYKLDKDYNVSLNRIIEENLFSDFDVA
jgi:hypothetical protein